MQSYAVVVLTVALLGVVAAAQTPAKPTKPVLPPAPEGVIIEQDVRYLPVGREEKLDLYLPACRANNVRSPAVVIIHGGGWSGGDKANSREFNIGTTLAKAGYVCASINYKLGKGDCWPTNLLDCKNAVRFLRANAEKYQIDTDHIGVIGGSAGGHLALMVGYTNGLAELEPQSPYPGVSDKVQAVVDMYGITNLITRQKTDASGKPIGVRVYAPNLVAGTPETNPDLWKLASPVYHVCKDSPPTLILQGTVDTTVDIDQSRELDRKLTEAGVEHELIILKDVGHTFDLQTWAGKPLPQDMRPTVIAFFDKHLKAGVPGAGVSGTPLRSVHETPSDFLSSKTISVRRDGRDWIIEGEHRKVTLSETDLAVTIKSGRYVWRMRPSQPDELTVESDGKRTTMALTSAGRMEFARYDTGRMTGVKIDLGDYKADGKLLDVGLQLSVCLEGGSEELVWDVVPTEGGARIKELRWPKAFEPKSIDATVIPAMQGMLVPADWPKKVYVYESMAYGRALYMPWWGYHKGKAAAALIIETPADAGCVMEHPAGGPTLMEIKWVHSLGKLRYPRRARIAFFNEGNYVTCAKRYRQYVIEKGKFVSLREKIARCPAVAKLIGTPVVHTSILYHTQPESSFYNKDNPAANHQLVTFDMRADQLAKLAAKGVKQAYVHLDGWGFRGYDNLHPDILPPCPEAGGWEGMKRLADTCDKLGYVFAVHDQYRDYYCDAASYDERRTVIREDGSRPFESTWAGGRQSILCSSFAPGYVKRNHKALLDAGIKLRGAYLDVFAVVPPDECYNPEHPVSRADCLKYRAECLDIVRAQLGVVSSEEPADWAIPHIDLVHHAPYALDPNPGGGGAMGIPIPLFELVYHDAIVTPWTASITKGGWGIPNTDQGYLHCLLNAGVPYISMSPDKDELARMRTMCSLHKRVGMLEMTKHEFLDSSYRKQRATYADGTTVTVDFDSGEFEVAAGR